MLLRYAFCVLVLAAIMLLGLSAAAVDPAPASQRATGGLAAWLQANWTWIAAVLAALPSIITALSKKKKTKGIASVLQAVLDVFSVLTHKDSPGTLKVPFTRSKTPKE